LPLDEALIMENQVKTFLQFWPDRRRQSGDDDPVADSSNGIRQP
jgi:hypothetical protein